MTMLGTSRRAADVLLVLALVVAATSVGLLALDRDPYLGYSSDPEVARALWWVVLPGLGLLLALETWALGRLVRSSVAAMVLTLLGGVCVALCLAGPVAGLAWGLLDRPT